MRYGVTYIVKWKKYQFQIEYFMEIVPSLISQKPNQISAVTEGGPFGARANNFWHEEFKTN